MDSLHDAYIYRLNQLFIDNQYSSQYDKDTSQYYFDANSIMGRIHLISPALFSSDTRQGALYKPSDFAGKKYCNSCWKSGFSSGTVCANVAKKCPECDSPDQVLFGKMDAQKSYCWIKGCVAPAAYYPSTCSAFCNASPFPQWIPTQCSIKDSFAARCPASVCKRNQFDNIPNFCDTDPCQGHSMCLFGVLNQDDRGSSAGYNLSSYFDPSNPNTGYVTLEFYSDLYDPSSKLNFLVTVKDPSSDTDVSAQEMVGQRSAWLTAGSDAHTEPLPTAFTYPLYVVSFLTSVLHLFYNEVYYNVPNTNNSFYLFQYKYMDSPQQYQAYVSNLVNMCSPTDFAETNLVFFKDMVAQAYQTLQLPLPEYTGGKFYLTFRFSPYQFDTWKSKSSKDLSVLLQNVLVTLLHENEVDVFNNVVTGSPYTPMPTLLIADWSQVRWTLLDLSINEGTSKLSILPPSTDAPTNRQYHLYYELKTEVLEMSPMLLVYLKIFWNQAFPLEKTAWFYNYNKTLVPSDKGTFEALFPKKDDFFQGYYMLCQINYEPSRDICVDPVGVSEKAFLNSSKQCYCMKSNIAPISATQFGNFASMCFDNRCDNLGDFLSRCGITDCQQYCPMVSSWIQSKNPSQTIQNSGQLNDVEYRTLCGDNFLQQLSLDYYTLVISFLILVGASFLALVRGFPLATWRKWTLGILVVLSALVAIFLAYLISGRSLCNTQKKKMVCYSNIDNIPLPITQCSKFLNCECAFNSDCSGEETCNSGICFKPGLVPHQTTKSMLDYLHLVFYLVLCVIIFLVVWDRTRNQKTILKKTLLWAYGGTATVMVVVFVLLYFFEWRKRFATVTYNLPTSPAFGPKSTPYDPSPPDPTTTPATTSTSGPLPPPSFCNVSIDYTKEVSRTGFTYSKGVLTCDDSVPVLVLEGICFFFIADGSPLYISIPTKAFVEVKYPYTTDEKNMVWIQTELGPNTFPLLYFSSFFSWVMYINIKKPTTFQGSAIVNDHVVQFLDISETVISVIGIPPSTSSMENPLFLIVDIRHGVKFNFKFFNASQDTKLYLKVMDFPPLLYSYPIVMERMTMSEISLTYTEATGWSE